MNISDRLLFKATYVPCASEPERPDTPLHGKWVLIEDMLSINDKPQALAAIVEQVAQESSKLSGSELAAVLRTAKLVDSALEKSASSSEGVLRAMGQVAKLSMADLGQLRKVVGARARTVVEEQDVIVRTSEESSERVMNYVEVKPPKLPSSKATMGEPFYGYLHLERLRFRPVDTCTGELLTSIPLAPGEEVHLMQRTWVRTRHEFSELVSAEIANESVGEHTEARELSESTKNEDDYAANLSTSFQGKGTIGIVELSASAASSLALSRKQASEESLKRSMLSTRKATARSKQEHKTTFATSSEVGREDESRRRLVNPNKTHAVEYEYYRKMRKWEVALEQYGVRLTLDVMVRDPGSVLREEVLRLLELTRRANMDVSCELGVGDIDERRLPAGAPAKPLAFKLSPVTKRVEDRSSSHEYGHSFVVPQGYRVAGVQLDVVKAEASDSPNVYVVNKHRYIGATGEVELHVHVGLDANEAWVLYTVTVEVEPTLQAISEWRAKVLELMCQARLSELLGQKNDAKAQLEEMKLSVDNKPTLVLRKEERDEIIKGVMAAFLPPNVPPELAPSAIVRFVHEAFELENLSYIILPYFWKEWEGGLVHQLAHRDLIRRDFLRASYARVLLPVRANYEKRVLAFAMNGDLSELTLSPGLSTVAEQVQQAAATTYAYECNSNESKEGYEVIAKWTEHTPTDALELRVKLNTTDIAEPSISQDRADEHASRVAEVDRKRAGTETSAKINALIEALPDDVRVNRLATADGEVELSPHAGG